MNAYPELDLPQGRCILVGVYPEQRDGVVAAASEFARRFDATLVCVWVDTSRSMVTAVGDGMWSMPIDPDVYDEPVTFDRELEQRITATLRPTGVAWRTYAIAGEPGLVLADVAEQCDASMIVVGTREATVGASIREFFTGSVAVHLAHRQSRPVVVIPLTPKLGGEPITWDGA